MVLEAVKVALDPSPAQERLLLSHAGAARFAFNAGLARVKEALDAGAKPEWSFYSLRKWWNANKDALAVSDDGVIWWGENSKEAYSSGLEALAKGLSNWAKSRKGVRKGRRVGFPRFKSKDRTVPRFAYTTGTFGLIHGDPKALRLPKIGRVHCMENVTARVGDAKVLRMTVSQRAGRWYASLTVEREEPAVREALSRKTMGSNRRAKARAKVARLHARVANCRSDAMHKATTWLASTYSDISIEDLNTAGMARNRRLAKAVSDAAFGEFRRQLEYKTARTGAALRVIDRWYPSSKTCSKCGRVKAKLSLSERVYKCDGCGLVMDRDLNAAVNIKVAGSAPETQNAHGETRSRSNQHGCATQVPVKCEPSSGANRVRLGADGRKPVLQTATK